MKKYLLPLCGNFYKANLHSHSSCSDGKLTPAEMKALYMGAGYSIIGYADHNVLIDHSDLNEENFLALTACEYNIDREFPHVMHDTPTYHINFYAEDPHNDVLPCFDPKYMFSWQEEVKKNQKYIGAPGYHRYFDKVNELVEEFCSHGFIAQLNHPTESLLTRENCVDLKNIFSVEMYNNNSYIRGLCETNEHMYDDMCRAGRRVAVTASDDNHDTQLYASAYWDSFGGFTMIKAEKLEYGAVIQAMKNGDMYASTGPEIRELYIEDGVIHAKSSPASRISFTTCGRNCFTAYPTSPHAYVDSAAYRVNANDGFVRVTVGDAAGHCAWSRAYFIDELLG